MKIHTTDIGSSRGMFIVLCKKSISPFRKGQYYPIKGFMGDPAGSIEAGEKIMSSDFLNAVKLMQGKGEYWFLWNGRKDWMFTPPTNLGYFQDYFIYDIKEERNQKLKEVNERNKYQ